GLTYQWFKEATAIAGATSSVLSITNVNTSNAGIYNVVVTGACGNPITNSASLSVNENTVIAAAPINQINCPGTMASFTVSATGTDLTYEWRKDSTAIAGAISTALSITNIGAPNAGIYSVVVSGACGNPITNSASLTVNENTIIATGPVNQTNCPGTTAGFSVNASGTALAYQWYKDSAPIGGATSTALSITNVSAGHTGIYSVVVSGACGSPITNSASLSVNENTVIATTPSNETNC